MKTRTIFNTSLLVCTTILAGTFSAHAATTSKKAHKAVAPHKAVVAPQAVATSSYGNQAISAPNATLDLSGGIMDSTSTGAISAIGDMPLGDKYGFQLDTRYRKAASLDAGGVGGHLFYRDPTSYLAGATAMWYNADGRNVFRYGAETEFYHNQFTLAPSAGLQRGAANRGHNNVAYYDVDASYYVNESLKFTLNGNGFTGTHGGYGEVEWQPDANKGLSLYAHVGDSSSAKPYAMVGVRINFGAASQTLQHRDRYSDPSNIVDGFDWATAAGNNNSDSIFHNHKNRPIPAPSPGGS